MTTYLAKNTVVGTTALLCSWRRCVLANARIIGVADGAIMATIIAARISSISTAPQSQHWGMAMPGVGIALMRHARYIK